MHVQAVVSQDYMRNTRTSDGVWGLPRGLEYYKASYKWQLSNVLDPEYIHETGLAEVERIMGEIENGSMLADNCYVNPLPKLQ
ncbi:hypothetical protein DPMN_000758 [Dreissena polymorpha]|uniref:Uncharacterized protein n=2 Tax=Dreissena polymorpha TaxID=45954 RepID=A0A9D4MIM3_DREPO|nr:hypothetical protein DPMN_000758 [Dreissena polymorpha]